MNTATSATPAWAEAGFLRQRSTPCVVVVAGIDRSNIVAAALADPALAESIVPTFEPACSPPCDAVLWRCETAAGQPLNAPGFIGRHWHRPPYALTIRLVRYQPGSSTPEVLDEGTIGTRGRRDAFAASVDRLAMRMVRDAALNRGRTPGGVPSGAPRGPAGWLDHQRSRWRDRLMIEWWSLGTSEAPIDDVLSGRGPFPVAWRNPASGERYLADPFPWPGTNRILCEEMPARGGTGRIVAVTDDKAPPMIVLDDAAHHSYPCTLAEADAVYCVPEATDRGCTRIYRLHADGWMEPVAEPGPHLRLADSTLFRHGGRYWIACTDLDVGTHDNLCLLHAPAIEGPWVPHRLWPAKIDVRGARPAGSVFERQGRLYRPAQDCAATYGAAVAINVIDVLTETDFAETLVTVLRPDRSGPFPHGLHTLVHDGQRFWIDGKRFVFDPTRAGRRTIKRLAGMISRAGAA